MMTLVHLALAVLLAPNGASFRTVPVPPVPQLPPLESARREGDEEAEGGR